MRVSGGVDELLLEAAQEPAVRAIAIASPNDPTGELLPTGELERLLDGLPDGVAVLLDEALVEFADAQPTSASLELLEHSPRLLVFRSFSKAWGLAGLRIGYAVGGPGSEEPAGRAGARPRRVRDLAGRRAGGPAELQRAHPAAGRATSAASARA